MRPSRPPCHDGASRSPDRDCHFFDVNREQIVCPQMNHLGFGFDSEKTTCAAARRSAYGSACDAEALGADRLFSFSNKAVGGGTVVIMCRATQSAAVHVGEEVLHRYQRDSTEAASHREAM